ncbi:NADH:flavin oxidoreductase [Geopsychrobacter electrodiphilus]|uniref:NADH:flavin oxidoreductase n=1 Tax=Geopsychrobacter electrodiphilus TaxID=225196 RepID=UPI0003812CDC|nr:NADH:flavin oxidoreductase [Geopsychrobacter electrodiphilus]
MQMLFSPLNLGRLTVKNRLMHSATYESMSETTGEVSPALLNRYRHLAKGGIGLIVPGHMNVHPAGKAGLRQTGIYSDHLISGLKKLVSVVHEEQGKLVFQLAHAGRQTRKEITGLDPIGPSNDGRDQTFGVEPKIMGKGEIQEVISAFGDAARRASEAGADGVQIHAAHGYLINQFLSPFFNRRDDAWGGSNEKRFRILQQIFLAIKKNVTADLPVFIKLNTDDFTPQTGITPELAAIYSQWLVELGIDGIEISSGTLAYSPLAMSRNRAEKGAFAFRENYHLAAAAEIKPVIGKVPLMLVGGMRTMAQMETILKEGQADVISLSRPFIMEPHLAKQFANGRSDKARCISCNNCLLAVRQGLPVKCSLCAD